MSVDYFTYSGLWINDLVFPDGRTKMGLIGGGGAEAAIGMRVWSDAVGLVAHVAPDFPADDRRFLAEACGIDLSGLVPAPYERFRLWLLYDDDQSRIEVMRGPRDWSQVRVPPAQAPAAYHHARGIHAVEPDAAQLTFLRHLKAAQGTALCVESLAALCAADGHASLEGLLAGVDIFSPDLADAIERTGTADLHTCLDRLQSVGADVLALRMGAGGSLIRHVSTGRTWRIPAVSTRVVDVTGAGNAYCGGCLIGWVETGDAARAGCYGAVAASFMIEQFALPRPDAAMRVEAEARRERVWQAVTRPV